MHQLMTNATVYRNGRLCKGDIAVAQGCIADGTAWKEKKNIDLIPMAGKLLIPGLVDVHVHLREPGFLYKETIATGTGAAARGGYTAVCAMPNVNPAPDTPEHVTLQLEAIRRDARVRVYPYGCITMGQMGGGELCDYEKLAPLVIAFSDDGRGVQDEQTMREAMRRIKAAGGLLAAHCEENTLLDGGYIHAGRYAAAHGHKGICSESEWRQIERDLRLSEETGCRYHVCHISCKESVELIRQAKRRGVDVTCETAPHYLLMDDSELLEDGRFKMNPPIRSREDRDALVEGLLDGTVDIIATDHAPHSAEEKSRGLEGSLMGVVGLEIAFSALYGGLCKTGKVPLETVLRAMTDTPRARFGLPKVTLEAGDPADIAVFDLDREWTVDPGGFASMGRATPFAGRTVWGRCELTMVGGTVV